jgi:hypothetical protein
MRGEATFMRGEDTFMRGEDTFMRGEPVEACFSAPRDLLRVRGEWR